MKRKAILIESSNVVGQTDLPGARIDIENWKSFLESELGGNWTSNEIVILKKPYTDGVRKELDVQADVYCFVAFSGHGSDGSVVLNDYYSNFSINELRPKTDRGTLIVDSCRGIIEATERAFLAKAATLNESLDGRLVENIRRGRLMTFNASDFGARKNFDYASSYTSKWANALTSSAKGTVEMLSCAKGQAAGENPKAGGFYTSLLMQAAEQFAKKNSAGTVQTTREAHDYAAKLLPLQQTPEYKPSWLAFPFAVSL